MRGARPSPRHLLAAAMPHRIIGATPAQYLIVPSLLSFWLNNLDGDCVTAEEAFLKACSGVFIADAVVQAWATKNGVLNGADLVSVMTWMQTAGFPQDGNTYNDGGHVSVDWTTAAVLTNAIAQGPVKIGVAATQLENAVGNSNGWLATGFRTDQNLDHCISVCGFGTIAWLLQQLGGVLPSNVDGTQPGYAVFTWNTIGVLDVPSLLAITGEAWLRNPATVTLGFGAPTPDAVKVYGGGPPTPIPIVPTPTPTPGTKAAVDAIFVKLESYFNGAPRIKALIIMAQQAVDQVLTAGNVKLDPLQGSIIDALMDAAIARAPELWERLALREAKAIIDRFVVPGGA